VSADQPTPDRARDWRTDRGVWRGIALALLLHVLQIPFAVGTEGTSLLFLGVTQLVYEVPALLVVAVMGRRDLAIGIVVGTAVSFLVAFGTCAAVLVSQ
jgi:hypothetical protein